MPAYAVDRLGRQPGTHVYLDAGNPGWIPDPVELVGPLRSSGVARADGIALNVSNFHQDTSTSTYGKRLSGLLGGTHRVIDTSRNGNGPYLGPGTDLWCNPPGFIPVRKAGKLPGATLSQAYDLEYGSAEIEVHAEDLSAGDRPAAGRWWPSHALELAANARG
ncbi:glycoside hydrolase family 6 protein [Streptomyces sp. NPDC005548]|uniref:glycoside hydrolase family 6 protein n=1 Tax=Streptomyces sp. NPDC005548 TaxID=3364724 RepID=UPI00368196CE